MVVSECLPFEIWQLWCFFSEKSIVPVALVALDFLKENLVQ